MGHQFSGAATPTAIVVTVATVLSGCGAGADESQLPPVLDNARAVVSTIETSDGSDDADSIESSDPQDLVAAADSPDASDPAMPADGPADDGGLEADQPMATALVVDELPAPDPSLFEGANRVVNLWVGEGGVTMPIDVWGRRTFTNGPVLLVQDLGFGEASDYFAAPPGHSIEVVAAGAGPDGEALAGVFHAAVDEQITTVVTNDDERGTVWAPSIWESDPLGGSQAPEPSPPDRALIVLAAPNTRSFADTLTASIGSDAFFVGDGSATCAPQRIEDEGFQAVVLGGTQQVELEVAPGSTRVTLHPWPTPEMCATPPVLELDVDVPVGGAVLVLVYSSDGVSVDALQLPIV